MMPFAKKTASLFLGLWLTAFCAIADSTSTPGSWEQVKEQDGITVYQREVPGWSIKEVRATGNVAASMQDLLKIINDVKYFGKINEIVSDAGVVQQNDPEKYYYFIVLDMPWPTTDRSAIYSRQVSVHKEKQRITIADKADSELDITPAMEDTVRIVRSTQEWKLQKMDDGTTKVSLTSLTDPNGPIPAFLINSMSVDAPMQSIANLRKLVRIPAKVTAHSVDGDRCAHTLNAGAVVLL